MKRKLLLPILSVCMVVALVSVGFAAWLITGNDADDTSGGNIVTHDVSNEFFTVTIEEDAEMNINYGHATVTDGWLQVGSDVGAEKLEVTFQLKITQEDSAALINWQNYTVKLTLKGGETDNKINGAEYANYIGKTTLKINDALKTEDNIGTDGLTLEIPAENFSVTEGVGTVTVTLTFTWGEKFNNKNPYEYYTEGKFTVSGDTVTYSDSGKTYGEMTSEEKAALRKQATEDLKAAYGLTDAQYNLSLAVVQDAA